MILYFMYDLIVADESELITVAFYDRRCFLFGMYKGKCVDDYGGNRKIKLGFVGTEKTGGVESD